MERHTGKPEPIKHDPDTLVRLLDLELKQKRTQWKHAGARHRSMRTASYAMLFFVIMGALVALFFVFSQATQSRPPKPETTTEPAP